MNQANALKDIWKSGMFGLVVGDALGVPVQFMSREEIAGRMAGPVTGMESGGVYDMPAGTWSDDSSMALATLVSLIRKGTVDCDDIMKQFLKWEFTGEYTPYGEAFDEGLTCSNAIYHYRDHRDVKTCGGTGERSNGNGSLMRILPVCLHHGITIADRQMEAGGEKEILTASEELNRAVSDVHAVSGLTHNHLRSRMSCGYYFFMVESVLEHRMQTVSENRVGRMAGGENSLPELLQRGITRAVDYYKRDILNLVEMTYLHRLTDLQKLSGTKASDIKSTGYVIDSIEAAMWCLITTDSYRECVLKAVNLGDDTDTVAAIAGGIAGLYYGYESIPEEWLAVTKRREWIDGLCERC